MEKEMMQQAANTFTTSPKTGWNSPIPWLFGGLALINQSLPTEEKLAKSSTTELQLDFVPVIVIMAGDDNPTCFWSCGVLVESRIKKVVESVLKICFPFLSF
ncbi:hypothetical protein POM88_044008 [Heracleum sosnowskyi]|uniref:Uncharacterized protein n=1 Tax=Heracleum sosnowskyi TaxID=360622 RepID=A0AAD8H4G6_9APIA|nr:hypothetical protein POM88_044008 [Heracleum sosnowskyi]